MEHISDPVNRVMDEIKKKMDEREQLKRRAQAIKFCKKKRRGGSRRNNENQFTLI